MEFYISKLTFQMEILYDLIKEIHLKFVYLSKKQWWVPYESLHHIDYFYTDYFNTHGPLIKINAKMPQKRSCIATKKFFRRIFFLDLSITSIESRQPPSAGHNPPEACLENQLIRKSFFPTSFLTWLLFIYIFLDFFCMWN